MTNKKSSYWIDRANERMDEYQKNATDVINKVNANYDKAIQDINQDIRNIFYRFAKDSDLTLEQAQKLLNSNISAKELDSIRTKINVINDKELKSYMIAKLNSKAYKARITRLEAIKESVYANLSKVADVELDQVNKLYISNISKSYYYNMYDIQRGLGTVFKFSALPISFIEETLKNKWSGKNYSNRIWHNNEVLTAKLEEAVTSGLMHGKSSRRMAKELEDMTEYGKYATERLIRTETTYVTNRGELESYKSAGVEKYIFVATLDLRTSKECREHDRKIYLVDKAVPGKNLPPLHPYCRSTTRAYIKGMKLGQRTARDPKTGKTYQIDNMNYDEWYEKFVVDKYGEQSTAKYERMIKNKSSDRKQYKRYQDILGNDVTKSFTEYRELKYNDSNNYQLIHVDYKRRIKLIEKPELKLTNVNNATIAEDKFTKYLFDGSNEKGIIKGKLITKELGYDITNYNEFEQEIKSRSIINPSRYISTDKYGDKYEQRIIMYGKNNNPTNVVAGWKVKDDKTHLTSIYVKEVKKNED